MLEVLARRRLPGVVFTCFLLESLVTCGGGTSLPSPRICDPTTAPEVWSLSVENADQESLRSYPVEVYLDKTNFDFTIPAQDGSDLAVWNFTTGQALPAWLESYDASGQEALLWVRLPAVDAQASPRLLLTAGHAAHCPVLPLDGYSVFPFFSDVHDVDSWQVSNRLSVTDTVIQGPLTIGRRSVIESDGMYNGFPGVVQAANGDFILSYKKGPGHVNSPLVIVRRSSDAGITWSPEADLFDSSQPDPALIETPLGALLIALGKTDESGNVAGAFSRSTDNGSTWGPFTFFASPPAEAFGVAPSLNVGLIMYGAGYGPFASGTGDTPSLWLSSDDGFTWTKRSELRQVGDPDLNETAIALADPNTIFAMIRTGDGLETYGRYSDDMGMSWGPLLSYGSQVGVLQAPQMIQVGAALILMGRETIAIPGVQPANTKGYPRQLVAFVSYDRGQTFGYGTVLDTYTGQQIDGGYCSPILLPNGQVYIVYYADSHNLQKPDIKGLMLSVGPPLTLPSDSIHVLSQLAPGVATHPLNLDLTRYALEFRFHSTPTPAGSQFSVSLQGQVSGSLSSLVTWELPSTHAADPTSDSGIISNQQFAPVLTNFTYGQVYRVRTVVDETLLTQQASMLDSFGAVINSTAALPLANEASTHVTAIQIGNNSNLRATDTLVDFVFVRPAAAIEPLVTVTRLH